MGSWVPFPGCLFLGSWVPFPGCLFMGSWVPFPGCLFLGSWVPFPGCFLFFYFIHSASTLALVHNIDFVFNRVIVLLVRLGILIFDSTSFTILSSFARDQQSRAR